jgi:23S rRNA (adenine2503-C2)-methyltransferase
MFDPYDLTRDAWDEQVASWGFPRPHAARIWKYLYRECEPDPARWSDLPTALRQRLVAEAAAMPLEEAKVTTSDDGATEKYLLRLHDGRNVETVQMRDLRRVTACLSSQVGCALGCVFCATGRMGFTRDLTTGEIVAQAMHLVRALNRHGPASLPRHVREPGRYLSNIVLMGMGEPLLNYDAVLDAIDILRDPGGLAIGAKQITLSTVGVIPGIVRLADERREASLAVSLHAATQAERLAIVPTARAWPLDELMSACRYYANKLDRKIFFEWTLIAGRNDSPDQAATLADLLAGIPSQVNLIPVNPIAGYDGEPTAGAALSRFRDRLRERGIPVSIRRRRGIEIAAGCGQLAVART